MQHPNNNTCVEQWYCNVVYPLNNGLCNIDGAINHVDGNIDMTVIVYKVDGATVKFSREYHRSHRWDTKNIESE